MQSRWRSSGGLRHDPIYNRLADRIHEAAKELHAVNLDHEFPNVLIFTNSDTHCGFTDLLGVLTGNFYAEGGTIEPIYKEISEGRIREEKPTIDLYVQLQLVPLHIPFWQDVQRG
jgi:hypothetical protein